MYFKIGPVEQDDNFSWIIVKNPSTVFERKLSKNESRYVKGWFDENAHYFQGYIKNDNLTFLQTARQLNMESYLHPQLSSVCPHNLRGLDQTFRSVLRGNKTDDGLTEEEYFAKKYFNATIGPFPHKSKGLIEEVFKSYGITLNYDYRGMTVSFMAQLSNDYPMSTTEFLQKIYLISYFTTQRYSMTPVNNEQIVKFSEICKNWLDESKFRNRIINTLSKKQKQLTKLFENNVLEDDSDEENGKTKEEKIQDIEEKLEKEGLHEKRHNFILDKAFTNEVFLDGDVLGTVVDLGCSEGRLLEKFDNSDRVINLLGIDANDFKIRKLKKRLSSEIELENTNILFPLFDRKYLNPDLLVLSEVIEHFEKEDRKKLLYNLVHLFAPKRMIITTPNYDYNVNYGMSEGEYRHRDHKIEFTRDQLENEVISSLKSFYDCQIDTIGDGASFAIVADRKENHKANEKVYDDILAMYSPHYMETCDYTIRKKELSKGFSNPAFLRNGNNIFYLAPTMSPVEFDPNHPEFLEHPFACFDYYRQRGIYNLVAEEKYMGSRGYVLFFKSREHAELCGFDKPIVVNSRGGFPFFRKEDEGYLDKLWNELNEVVTDDFIVLDCEIMPWIYKARGLAEFDFRVPGECAYLHRSSVPEDLGEENARKFLNTLDVYTQDHEFVIRPFHILACGNIKVTKGNKVFFKNVKNGFADTHSNHMHIISSMFHETEIFRPCRFHYVNVQNDKQKEYAFNKWREFCESGGEGYVYKPWNFLNYTDNLYLVQPAIKVRGEDYLRLVYGIDYLEPDYFKKVTNRNVKKKRILAVQEQIMSMRILQCFLNRNDNELKKSIAGFLGMENVNMQNIDATL